MNLTVESEDLLSLNAFKKLDLQTSSVCYLSGDLRSTGRY